MRVNISAKEFDLSAVLEVETLPDHPENQRPRRVTKVATLDGGVVVNDGGYTHGDRDVDLIYLPVSEAHNTIARRLIELHSRVVVSMPDGCFEAAPASFNDTPGRNTFSLSIISKLSED